MTFTTGTGPLVVSAAKHVVSAIANSRKGHRGLRSSNGLVHQASRFCRKAELSDGKWWPLPGLPQRPNVVVNVSKSNETSSSQVAKPARQRQFKTRFDKSQLSLQKEAYVTDHIIGTSFWERAGHDRSTGKGSVVRSALQEWLLRVGSKRLKKAEVAALLEEESRLKKERDLNAARVASKRSADALLRAKKEKSVVRSKPPDQPISGVRSKSSTQPKAAAKLRPPPVVVSTGDSGPSTGRTFSPRGNPSGLREPASRLQDRVDVKKGKGPAPILDGWLDDEPQRCQECGKWVCVCAGRVTILPTAEFTHIERMKAESGLSGKGSGQGKRRKN